MVSTSGHAAYETITLNAGEVRIATGLGKLRYAANRSGGVQDQRRDGTDDPAWIDIEGMGGELVFCRLFNSYPDLSIEPRKGGHDCLYGSLRVDVKTTRYPEGKLIAVASKDPVGVDLYALVVGTLPTYRFAGFAWASDLLRTETLTDLGHGPTYALDQVALTAFPKPLIADDINW